MVVSGQIDVFPAERRQMRKVNRCRMAPLLAYVIDGALQVHGVPQNDCGNEQVQAAGTMKLVFIGTVPNLAKSIEENRAAERILLLALVESNVTTPTQFWILQPVERKECAFQFAEFAQCVGETVLTGIGGQFAQDYRGGDRSRFDRRGEAQQFEPMIADRAKIDGTRYQRDELSRHCHAGQCIVSIAIASRDRTSLGSIRTAEKLFASSILDATDGQNISLGMDPS